MLNWVVEPWAAAKILGHVWGTALEPVRVTPTGKKAVPYRLSSRVILVVENADAQIAALSVMSGGSRLALFWMSGVSAIELLTIQGTPIHTDSGD